jgi:hypothetical protein
LWGQSFHSHAKKVTSFLLENKVKGALPEHFSVDFPQRAERVCLNRALGVLVDPENPVRFSSPRALLAISGHDVACFAHRSPGSRRVFFHCGSVAVTSDSLTNVTASG